MNVITIISPLVLIAVLGFICTKTAFISKTQLDALSKFTFQLSIPAFLFYQMANAQFADDLEPQFFAAFYLPVLSCYLLAWLVNYYFHCDKKNNSTASAVFALGASYSNTVIVGLPVLLMLLGEQVIAIIFLIVTFHSAMLFTLTGVIAMKTEADSSKKNRLNVLSSLKQTFNNPLILSILLGLLVNVLNISIPEFLSNSLLLLGKPAITLALFSLGASLAFYRVRSEINFIVFASLSKLLILPIFVYLAAQHIFSLPEITVQILVVLSACPTGVNAYLIAKQEGEHQETVAGSVVMSTMLSIVTIPAWLFFLGL
jgi:predicted permease